MLTTQAHGRASRGNIEPVVEGAQSTYERIAKGGEETVARRGPGQSEIEPEMAAPQGKRVMIAVDDSEASAHAFHWAIGNFLREGDHLIVLSAAPYVNLGFPNADLAVEYGVPIVVSGADSEKAEKKATSQSKLLVQKYVDMGHAKNISCEGEAVKGDAGSWIVDEGERVKADAIVVGSNAKGLFQRTFVGSVSDYVLHNAPCTVAIVRTPEDTNESYTDGPLTPKSSRKIVIAVDESKEAIYAFTWALKHFCKPADHVILYHVHQPNFSPVTGIGAGQFGIEEVYLPLDMSTRDEVESLKESQKIVEKFMKYADKETKIHCEGMVVTGQTESKVVNGLVSLKADAVVVGTHDRGAVARTLLGSVSDHLAHNTPCPLIVAKPRKESKVGVASSSHIESESKLAVAVDIGNVGNSPCALFFRH
ncbi:hypothetical protein R1flu_025292 [Riccia fluitans]|uniref:UspA domain-containing protein n=1 Tax=Riccia fluitans TaxID=41844 RepID=A0ABD1XXP9_9MARC